MHKEGEVAAWTNGARLHKSKRREVEMGGGNKSKK